MSDDLDLAALRRVAEAATQDEWWDYDTLRVDCGFGSADAAYVGSVSPAVALRLLARLKAAERAAADAWRQGMLRAAEMLAQRIRDPAVKAKLMTEIRATQKATPDAPR